MPIMTLRATDSHFESVSNGDFATVDDAYRAAVLSGLEIAAAEISAGVDSCIVAVAVDLVGCRDVARGAVSVSTGRMVGASAT